MEYGNDIHQYATSSGHPRPRKMTFGDVQISKVGPFYDIDVFQVEVEDDIAYRYTSCLGHQ